MRIASIIPVSRLPVASRSVISRSVTLIHCSLAHCSLAYCSLITGLLLTDSPTRATIVSMRFDIFTLFPSIFESPLQESILKRAVEAGSIEVRLHNIRDYAADKHHVTDDYPYGGGGGMVMKPEPIFAAVESVLG